MTDYVFDLVGSRLEKQTHTNPDWTALAAGSDPSPDEKVTYAYDDNDRLSTEVATSFDGQTWTTGQTTTYGYDATQQTNKTVWQGTQYGPGQRRSSAKQN